MHGDFPRKGVSPLLAWWIIAAGVCSAGWSAARIHLAITHWDSFMQAPIPFLTASSGLVW